MTKPLWSSWADLGRLSINTNVQRGRQLAALPNASGGVDVHLVGDDGEIWRRSLDGGGAQGWGPWHGLGNPSLQKTRGMVAVMSHIAAGRSGDGRAAVFHKLRGNNLLDCCLLEGGRVPGSWVVHSQNAGLPNDGRLDFQWMVEQATPGDWVQMAVATDGEGRVNVFAIASDQTLYRYRLESEAPPVWSAQDLGVRCQEVAVACNGDGVLEVFYGAAGQPVRHFRQAGVGSREWSPVRDIFDRACEGVAAVRIADGRVAAFVIADKHAFVNKRVRTASDDWMGWHNLGGNCRKIIVPANGQGHAIALTGYLGLDHIQEDAASETGWSQRMPLTTMQTCGQVAAAQGNGRLDVVFLRLPDGADPRPQLMQACLYDALPGPAGWSAWQMLDDGRREIAVGQGRSSNAALAIGRDQTLFHFRKDGGTPTGWSARQAMSGQWKRVAITACHPDLTAFAIHADGTLRCAARQASPDAGGPWSDWQNLGGNWEAVAPFGHIKSSPGVVALGADGTLRYTTDVKASGESSTWATLEGSWKRVAAGLTRAMTLDVFAIGTDDQLYYQWADLWNRTPRWMDWQCLGGAWKEVAVSNGPFDYGGVVFAIGMDDALHRMHQTPHGWSAWETMGGRWSRAAAFWNANGPLEVCAISQQGVLYNIQDAGRTINPWRPPLPRQR